MCHFYNSSRQCLVQFGICTSSNQGSCFHSFNWTKSILENTRDSTPKANSQWCWTVDSKLRCLCWNIKEHKIQCIFMSCHHRWMGVHNSIWFCWGPLCRHCLKMYIACKGILTRCFGNTAQSHSSNSSGRSSMFIEVRRIWSLDSFVVFPPQYKINLYWLLSTIDSFSPWLPLARHSPPKCY
jgi:hypothetical protein